MFKYLGDTPPISSTLEAVSFSPPLLNCDIHKQQQQQPKKLKRKKFIYFILEWPDKRTETRLYPCRPQPIRPQPIRPPLPFKIIYINIVPGLKIPQCLCNNNKNSSILVYMILNGKGFLTGCFFLFNSSITLVYIGLNIYFKPVPRPVAIFTTNIIKRMISTYTI